MKPKYQVPYDLRKTARENVIEWVGEDDRMMQFITHCDIHEIPLRFVPGENWCYIDALSPHENPLAEGDRHTMTIDLNRDKFFLFGSEDIAAGIVKLDKMYEVFREKAVKSEVQSLLRL